MTEQPIDGVGVDLHRELNNIPGDTIHTGCVLDITPDTKETA